MGREGREIGGEGGREDGTPGRIPMSAFLNMNM
jgi:hypothetical protein